MEMFGSHFKVVGSLVTDETPVAEEDQQPEMPNSMDPISSIEDPSSSSFL